MHDCSFDACVVCICTVGVFQDNAGGRYIYTVCGIYPRHMQCRNVRRYRYICMQYCRGIELVWGYGPLAKICVLHAWVIIHKVHGI